ncbi:hypothetical protein B9Z19DRAFT_1196320 [Tuber borchii]|uniref:Mid2 domain-containing protein n=1 Tax=Tuber borchii TaxID=42251 RepID=A0A2T6ZFN8_TUBBO|nr:hypothetical protein B9Z19DRAFT_1196320 [Tuber borchii]
MSIAVVAAAGSRSHALMASVALLALLFMLLHAVAQGAAEAAFIGGGGVEVGRVMSCGLERRGELNNGLTRGVRANTPDTRKKELSEVIGHLNNSGRTALLFIIGTLAPLSILAIWVLKRMRKRPPGPGNDPERQVGEHCPAAYPLRLVSPLPPPSPSPSGPGSAITPPPPAHQNGRNKQLPKTKTSYTSSLTSIGASSTTPAKTGEAEIPYLPIFTRLKNKHETTRMGAERGEGGSSYLPIPVFTRLKNKHEGTNRMEQEEENGDPLLRQRWA